MTGCPRADAMVHCEICRGRGHHCAYIDLLAGFFWHGATAKQQEKTKTDLVPVFAVANIGLDADNQSWLLIPVRSMPCGVSEQSQPIMQSNGRIRGCRRETTHLEPRQSGSSPHCAIGFKHSTSVSV